MKILLVGNYFYPEHIGGVEVVSYNLLKHYRRFGRQVRWVAADVPPNYRRVNDGDVPIKAWNIAEERLGFPHPIPLPGTILKLIKHVRWSDVVHIQDCLYPINIQIFILALILKKPVLITQYAKVIKYSQYYKRLLQEIAYKTIGKIMFNAADKVVFITKNVRDDMQFIVPNKRLEVVPLGVDTDFYNPISALERTKLRKALFGILNSPTILFIGRMVERKGIHLLKPIIEKHSEWNWVLVGRSDDIDPGEWSFPNLIYKQFVDEMELRDYYRVADLLVHPSSGEGITLIVTECMACGTPVLVSIESLSELAEEDLCYYYSVNPTTPNIENALVTILSDSQKLGNMRPSVRDFITKRQSWEKISQDYLFILEKLCFEKKE